MNIPLKKVKDSQSHNIFIFLLVMAFFTGATIQFSEGSPIFGIVLFLTSLFLTTRIKFKDTYITKSSNFFIILGSFIILGDISYNLNALNQLGTLDSMTFFLGTSFMAFGMKKPQYRRMGEFGIFMSSTFIILFIIFYSLLPSINNNFIHYFDHYFVLLPSLFIVTALTDIAINVVGIETVSFSGYEDASVVIGGPCSGLYSMFLLIGIIIGYAKMEGLKNKRSIAILIAITVIIAYISNLLRVSVLYYIGYNYGIVKMMSVHVHLGWVIFIVISFGIMLIMNKIR